MTWTPRSSSLGGYLACEFRALLDRMAHDARTPRSGDDDTRYADLGTIIHHKWQTAIGAAFVLTAEAPTDAHAVSAARLTDNRVDQMHTLTQTIANRAAGQVLATYEGTTDWVAEKSVTRPGFLSGHIDLWSPSLGVVIDLKTTSRKPDHMRMKPEHLVQLIAYYMLLDGAPRYGVIQYTDSRGGEWALWCVVDYAAPDVQAFIGYVREYVNRLNSDVLGGAIPHPGTHCSGTFCPHRAACKDSFLPGPGMILDFNRATPARGIVTQGL